MEPAFSPETTPEALATLERALAELEAGAADLGDIVFYSAASFVLAVDEFSSKSPQRIPYRKSNYFQVVALHPGLHPKIATALDAHLKRTGMSLAEYRLLIQREYPEGNPFRRPLPLGVSLGVRCGAGPEAEILAVRRTPRVALNPSVLTTPVDEGIQTIRGFPATYLAEGLQTEIHYGDLSVELQSELESCNLLGLTFPEKTSTYAPPVGGRRSGVNILYDIALDEFGMNVLRGHMDSIGLDPARTHEIGPVEKFTCTDLLRMEDASHTLLEYAHWVATLTESSSN